jgi:hypothetical protein
MVPSTLKRFTKVLVLGAVVAGAAVATAGAVTRPPDATAAMTLHLNHEDTLYRDRPSVSLPSARKPVDPLAVGYLIGMGLSPSEITSWTVGSCSHAAKPASCYAILDRHTVSPPPAQAVPGEGFNWRMFALQAL